MRGDNEALDPGIRQTVDRLRAAGFETTDSGDGRTKFEDGRADESTLRIPHVFARTTEAAMCIEARRMRDVLGLPWIVEASFSTRDGQCILFAYRDEDNPSEAAHV